MDKRKIYQIGFQTWSLKYIVFDVKMEQKLEMGWKVRI